MKKRILVLTAVVLAAICAAPAYFYLGKPAMARPVPVTVAMTPERIARGKYIFTLSDCDGCHSERDFTRFNGPVVASGRGAGNVFPPDFGLPGTISAPNITPDKETGIGNWTDGEKIRAIREGIGRDGRALFPMMPYRFYRHMSDEDVHSLVAYLNTLPPVRHAVPRSKVKFPVSMLIRTEPKPAGSVPAPDRSDKVKYGEYLATLGNCLECHTNERENGPRLAGGVEFRFPMGSVVSANITPDLDTGIGKWTEESFINRFYQYREYAEKGAPVAGPESFTLMPWLNLCKLPPEDLKAIYAFLRTQPPIYNPVETHPPLRAGN